MPTGVESLKEDFTDLRDLAGFPNYEPHDQPRFEEYLRPGPMPGVSS